MNKRLELNAGLLAGIAVIVLCTGLNSACSKREKTQKTLAQLTASAPAAEQSSGSAQTPDLPAVGTAVVIETAISLERLLAIVEQFLAEPTQETYTLVRFAWLGTVAKIEQLNLLAALEFDSISATEPASAPFAETLEQMTCWPVEAGYLDGFGEHPYSGIVHDISVPMEALNLRAQHQSTASNEATLGLYALGVVLFGPDQQRPLEHFIAQARLTKAQRDSGFRKTSELANNRRRELIKLQINLLASDIAHLHSLLTDPSPEGFSSRFNQQPKSEQVNMIRSAMSKQTTELLNNLVNFQKSSNAEILSWQQHVFATRVQGQIDGWLLLAESLPLEEKEFFIGQAQLSKDALSALLQKPYDKPQEDPQALSLWSTVFQNLKQLSMHFNNSSTE